MRKPCFLLLFLLVLLFSIPLVGNAETAIDSLNEGIDQLIEECIADGMTMDEIAYIAYQSLPAESFQGYSDDSLKLLIGICQCELKERGFSNREVTVQAGNYLVAEDIPVGVYTIALNGDSILATAYVRIYSVNGEVLAYHRVSASESIGKLSLSDGQTVQIEGHSVIFSPYKGLGF